MTLSSLAISCILEQKSYATYFYKAPKAYGIPIEGALVGLSTEEKPTAARVSKLVKEIKQAGVPTIFAETTINPRLIETVAREANVKVSERELYTDGLGEKGTEAETYQRMVIANTRTIIEGLGGKYAPFKSTAASSFLSNWLVCVLLTTPKT